MSELTHGSCSERLEAYVSGRLDAPDRQEVDDHLATCPDCSLELVAVQALRAPEVLVMSGTERDALSRGVKAAVFSAPKTSFLERFGRRFAPAVGAVALVALAAVALVSLPQGSDEPASQPQTSAGGGDDADTEAATTDATGTNRDVEKKSEARTLSDGGTGGGAAAGGGPPAAAQEAPEQESGDLAAATAGTALNARAGFTMEKAAFSATGLDVGALVPAISPPTRFDAYDGSSLAGSAPTQRLAQLVDECADLTISTSPHRLVPTSAAYYSDDVLVIGFVWLEESSTLLNYELRGWIGGQCDRISPIYRRGTVE